MKKILGLDLGTNSIGWALIEQDFPEKAGSIIGMGSRIIPMDQGTLGEFERGNTVSQTKERTRLRSVRRLRERHLLRRNRLHTVLNMMGFLPEHFANEIDFEKHYGQFRDDREPKLPYRKNPVTGQNEFIFMHSFEEMLHDFKKGREAGADGNRCVPYDWTIYYLREKALREKIEKEELAWLILTFNQKRGYYQLRGEDEEEQPGKLVQFHSFKVTDVQESGDRSKEGMWYNVFLENGWIYRRSAAIAPDWVGKTKDFIVTTDLNEDGTVKLDKDGKEKRSFRAPVPDDWTLVKKKTEHDLEQSHKTVGAYIYANLLQNPAQKIRGGLVRTIERKYYRTELNFILEKQKEFHPELRDEQLLNKCIRVLYPQNEQHRKLIAGKGFTYLFLQDIIFYQRPLKSKRYQVSNCRYESRTFINSEGEKEIQPLKCAPKSHPVYQEFRLWQFLCNLKLYKKDVELDGLLHPELDVTAALIPTEETWVELFDWLNSKESVSQESFFKFPGFGLRKSAGQYRWNYVEDKEYPCNETRARMITCLNKVKDVPLDFLTREREEKLWHILYSVTDKTELTKALRTFARKNGLKEDFAEHFAKYPPFKSDFGSYSLKALNKILPPMRRGRYWQEEQLSLEAINRFNSIKERLGAIGNDTDRIREVVDDEVQAQLLRSFIVSPDSLKGLSQSQACYAIYGRHSEEGEVTRWRKPTEIDHFLKHVFRQHSLRNPVVEQVIAESLRVVRDIWTTYGLGQEDFFDEIHIELGRDMKNSTDKRRKISQQIARNENTNLRIKALLTEMAGDSSIENVRPHSPGQQEILKIYEEDILGSCTEIPEDILKISRSAQPSTSELIRYKLWLEQKYRSPYTGAIIPLARLFTPDYEIEHIIPQSRYFDDSLSNKVICETAVNRDKTNQTGFEYIKNNAGKILETGPGKTVKVFSREAYQDFVKSGFRENRGKMKRLLMDEIPDAFVNRQINDTRYISRVVKNLLSNVVREEGEVQTTSKKVVASNGTITTVLKRDWGLHDIWAQIISPRFIRLNEMTGTNHFGEWVERQGRRTFQIRMPLELQKGFDKKRIDHRHHAMDALVIACATRNHINFLNNEYAKSDYRYDLRNSLCYKDFSDNNGGYRWTFHLPWSTFAADAKQQLEGIIVSFKQNTRVLNKTINRYRKMKTDPDGATKTVLAVQSSEGHWAIRKPLHKDTVAGRVELRSIKLTALRTALESPADIVDKQLKRHINNLVSEGMDKKQILASFKSEGFLFFGRDVSKVDIYYRDAENVATRSAIDISFSSAQIASVTDSGIRTILLKHLERYNEHKEGKTLEHPELAFSPDGLDTLNNTLTELNNGKAHMPLYRVRIYEPVGNKFVIGYKGNKKSKFVEAAKGSNLFFAIYQDDNGKRFYDTIPMYLIIERLKQGLETVSPVNDNGDKLLFHLSPNDLIYIGEGTVKTDFSSALISGETLQRDRIYKVVSSTGSRLYAIPHTVSSVIVDKFEFTQLNKIENTPERQSIKEVCVKLNVDRLGRLTGCV